MSEEVNFQKESPELDKYIEDSFSKLNKDMPTLEWRDFRIGFIAGALSHSNSSVMMFQHAFKELIDADAPSAQEDL